MQVNVTKGLATWAGLVAAVGQYALALALFMDTFNDADPLAGLGALATATATLWKVIEGRMKQATAVTDLQTVKVAQDLQVQKAAATVASYAGVVGQRAYAGGQFRQDDEDYRELPDVSPPQGPDASIANPELDDPGYLPTREQHTNLRG